MAETRLRFQGDEPEYCEEQRQAELSAAQTDEATGARYGGRVCIATALPWRGLEPRVWLDAREVVVPITRSVDEIGSTKTAAPRLRVSGEQSAGNLQA